MNKLKNIFSFIILFIIFAIIYIISYNTVESKAYDFMMSNITTEKLPFDNSKKIYGNDDIVLVVIDNKTVEKYRWPWKREQYGKIISYLNLSGAKIIVHDSILTATDKENPQSDKIYFDTIKNTDNLIEGFMPLYKNWEQKDNGKLYDEMLKKYKIDIIGNTNTDMQLYRSWMPFPQEYYDVVKNAGSVSTLTGFIHPNIFSMQYDDVIRLQEYIFPYYNNYYPSLSLKTFLMLNNNPKAELTKNGLYFPELNYEVKISEFWSKYYTPIKFYKMYPNGYSHKKYSAVDIIDSYNLLQQGKEPLIAKDVFKNKIVVFGANVTAGTGVNDVKTTSIHSQHPGVDIQATSIDNIINNDFMYVINFWFNLLITLSGMILIYCLIRCFDIQKSVISIVSLIFIYLIICGICFYNSIIINIFTPPIMFVMTTILAYTHKFVLEKRSKEKVKSAMGKYMSENVMEKIIQNIDNLGLGGKKANVTVLFADIRGFTSMSEKMSAQEVSEILNEYFSEMEPIITKYNGIINKFIGDAIMAIFGEPIQDINHAQNAVKCGYEMLQKVNELQIKWTNQNKPKIEIGIGINTGEVFVGNIGSVNRMEYTVIGDTVNLASRLESYNKEYHTKMLISSTTYEYSKDISNVRKIADVQIRGKVNKIDIYEFLSVKNGSK